jgi:cell division inhibitor SepF
MANPLKKTMVYLGLAEEELEYEQTVETSIPAQQVTPSAHQSTRAHVTPLRKATPTRNAQPAAMNEILTVHPRTYNDAPVIAENFREGVPVIINLSQMNDAEARRLIDFASGLSQGLFGKIERVTSKVFLLSPEHIAVSGDAAVITGEVDTSFFAN